MNQQTPQERERAARRALALALAAQDTGAALYVARQAGWDATSDPARVQNGRVVMRVMIAHHCAPMVWHEARSLAECKWIVAGHVCPAVGGCHDQR